MQITYEKLQTKIFTLPMSYNTMRILQGRIMKN